jgi:hypothetical protein
MALRHSLVLFGLAVWVGQATPPPPDPALIRVSLSTSDRGDAADVAERQQSVRDLVSALAGKKRTMVVVADEKAADLRVTVVSRAYVVPKVVLGLGPRPGQPMTSPGPVRAPVLRVQLAQGDLLVEFTNTNKPTDSSLGWKSAADNVAGQIDKWAAARRADILGRRR